MEFVVDFIREYADRFHHAKKEDILFAWFDWSATVSQAMREDHNTAREHVQQILVALDRKDDRTMGRHLGEYRRLLREHIRREDEVLYPWLDRGLSVSQVGQLFAAFRDPGPTVARDAGARPPVGRLERLLRVPAPSVQSPMGDAVPAAG